MIVLTNIHIIKKHIEQLALLGGEPAFDQSLHVGRPNIGRREVILERINDVLDRRWLTNQGPYVQELEDRLAHYLGVRHCIPVVNATIGLEILVRALGLSGEVILPSFTFVATAHALQWQQITPVFCDIDPATHNLDPLQIEKLITSRTSAILGVHVWGRPCAIEVLTMVAKRYGLKLLFDAAHAFSCSNNGRMLGNFGNAEVFSFHATKFFNTFEGGAIATNDSELAAKVRLMKNFGFAGHDNVVEIGTNGKMSEVAAAMGLAGLESLGEFVAVNAYNHALYRQGLAGLPGISLVSYEGSNTNSYQYIVLEVDAERSGLSRDMLLAVLHAEHVLARRYFYPGCHRMEPYRSYYPNAGFLLEETERLCERVILLPTGTAVSAADIDTVCQIIRLAVENSTRLQAKMF